VKRHYKFCVICRRTIAESELALGLYDEDERGLICATCAQKLDEPHQPPHHEPPAHEEKTIPAQKPLASAPKSPRPIPDEHEKHFTSLENHLERIHRALIFEKSSPWNVVGAVAQCLAVGVLITAAFRWLQSPENLLLVALIFQVMALTCFLKGK